MKKTIYIDLKKSETEVCCEKLAKFDSIALYGSMSLLHFPNDYSSHEYDRDTDWDPDSHDPGLSEDIEIKYCPFCGSILPRS